MRTVLSYILLCVVLFSVYSCKTTKNQPQRNPVVLANPIPVSSVRYSKINIPINLNRNVVSDIMDMQLDSILANQGLQKADGMAIEISRDGDSKIEIGEKNILSIIPLRVQVTKDIFLAKIKAEGIIELQTNTAIDIDQFWNFSSKTELLDYRWVENMRVTSGIGNLSLNGIADRIIENSKESYCAQIDQALSDNINLQQLVDNFASEIREPIQFDSPYTGFIQISPDTIALAPFYNQLENASSHLSVHVQSKLHRAKPDQGTFQGLPRFEWMRNEDEVSELLLPAEITYQQLEQVVSAYLVGQTFEEDGRSVTIDRMTISGKSPYIIAEAVVSGSFNGTLVITGIPDYDKEKYLLYARDVDIKVKTKNVLQQAAAWLGKGVIKKKLEQLLVFSLEDQMGDVQDIVDESLKSLDGSGVRLQAKIEKIDIDQFLLLDDYIQATLIVDAKLRADLVGMPALFEK